MARHYYLGMAANYRAADVLRHLFATGSAADSAALKIHLAKRYRTTPDRVALYATGRSALAAALKAAAPLAVSQKTAPAPEKAQKPEKVAKTEVVITALTCYAVVEAVRAAGFTPVFADVDEKTLHFSAATLEKVLKTHPRARLVVVQNNLGVPVDIASIEKCCKKHNAMIVEDLAHCAGVRYPDGREAGTVGVAAALSFGKGKSVDTISGGALVLAAPEKSAGEKTASKKPAAGNESAENLVAAPVAKQPKARPPFPDSFRARFYPLFGAIMRGLSYLGLTKYFTAALLKLHLIQRSADAPLSLTTRCSHWQARLALRQLNALPESRPPLRRAFLVRDREELLTKLRKNGFIFDEIWYDLPVSPARYYKKAAFPEKSCPVAVKCAQKLVNLPTYYPESALKPAEKLIKEYRDA